MTGRGAAVLCHTVEVRFRRLRPHERIFVPAGQRALVAIAYTVDGPEERVMIAPDREAKAALNPRNRGAAHQLAAGVVPAGWSLA